MSKNHGYAVYHGIRDFMVNNRSLVKEAVMIKIKSAKLSRLMLRYAAPDPQFVGGESFIIWDDGAVSKLPGGLHPGQGQMREIEPAFKVLGIDAGFFGDLGSMQFRDHYYAFTNEAGWQAIREYLGYHERMITDYLETLA